MRAFVMAVLMWLVTRAAPTAGFVLPARRVLATCVALAGVSIAIAGIAEFRRVGTTVNPLRPEKASSLVVSGIYNITRDPAKQFGERVFVACTAFRTAWLMDVECSR